MTRQSLNEDTGDGSCARARSEEWRGSYQFRPAARTPARTFARDLTPGGRRQRLSRRRVTDGSAPGGKAVSPTRATTSTDDAGPGSAAVSGSGAG